MPPPIPPRIPRLPRRRAALRLGQSGSLHLVLYALAGGVPLGLLGHALRAPHPREQAITVALAPAEEPDPFTQAAHEELEPPEAREPETLADPPEPVEEPPVPEPVADERLAEVPRMLDPWSSVSAVPLPRPEDAATAAAAAEATPAEEPTPLESPDPGTTPAREEPSAPRVPTAPVVLLVEAPAPDYPRVARRLGWEGTVTLRLEVGDDGRVASAAVVDSSGHALLDQAAREAVLKWRFRPEAFADPAEPRSFLHRITFELTG